MQSGIKVGTDREAGRAGRGVRRALRRIACAGALVSALLGLTASCGSETEKDPPQAVAANPPPAQPSTAAIERSVPSAVAPGAVPPVPVGDAPLPSLAPLLERVAPAVVSVTVTGRSNSRQLMEDPFWRFFGPPQMPERQFSGAGSGVIVDAERGLLLSNHHVVANADQITVTLLGGEQRKAEVVGSDSEADIAVLRVKPDGLSAVVEGDSSALRVGDFVVAIGNPFGLGQTVTSGIVSALGRSGLGIAGYEDFIQTDASINPGNSGGALINLRGELVGINTAIVAPSGGNVGIGFAIPVNMARSLMAQIMENGEVRRGQIGVGIQDLTPEVARGLGIEAKEGALITQVEPGSPADKAGLERADLVVAVDGVPIRGSGDLRNRIGLLAVGKKIQIEVLREGERKKIEVEVGERRQRTAKLDASNSLHPALAGAAFQDAGSTPSSQGKRGVEIVAVEADSPAARVGLRPGDIIVQVNLKPVANLDDLRTLVSGDGPRVLAIERGDRAFYLALR